MIYLDNAATSFHKPESVIAAVADAMRHMGNSGRGSSEAALSAARVIYGTREKLAAFFGAKDPARVIFTANSTEALNIAIQGSFTPGGHVITTAMEHNSVLRPLYMMQARGVRLSIVPAAKNGMISYEDLEAEIGPDTQGIVCTHASNLTGNMIDIARVGRICRAHGIRLIVDASQTAGVFDIDMEQMCIDILCFTGHKSLLGPQGTGGMCIREGITVKPLLSGGTGVQSYRKTQPEELPEHLEAGTLNGHGIAGLSAALDFLNETELSAIRARELELTKRFYDAVQNIPGIHIYGDFSDWTHHAPVVALNLGSYDSSEVADELATRFGIYTRAGAHCAPLMHEALGTKEQGAVRFSVSYFNTEDEIDKAAQALLQLSGEAGLC